jgi:hypothetical protein
VRGIVVDPDVGLGLGQRVEGRDHGHPEPVLQRVCHRPGDPVVRVEHVGTAGSAQPPLGGVDELVVEADQVVLGDRPARPGLEMHDAHAGLEGHHRLGPGVIGPGDQVALHAGTDERGRQRPDVDVHPATVADARLGQR